MEVQISAAQTSYSLVSLQQIPVGKGNDVRKTLKLEKKPAFKWTIKLMLISVWFP